MACKNLKVLLLIHSQ